MPDSAVRKDWLMGIDLGAGSLKTTIISRNGQVVGSASCDVATHSPQPRWSEQDPADWWRALCITVPEALRRADVTADRIAGISFSAGAHTPVLVGENGQVLRPAILWSDQRSGDQCKTLLKTHGSRILEITLNTPTPTWTMPQLLWLAQHEPGIVRATHRLYVAKDWLRSRLTGDWVTDHTEATGTLLVDPQNLCWSQELCDAIGWNMATLPPLVEPKTIVGHVSPQAALQAGLAVGTPVVCGTSDTSIETFGAGSFREGDCTIKLATAATISIVARHPTVDPSLINYPLVVPGLWYTISGTNSCASAHRWLRDKFFMQPGDDGAAVFDEMDKLAGSVPPGAEGLIFHPYLQGERAPYWDPLLRADFVGLTFAHGRAHLVRALYEGIAFALRDVMDQFRKQGITMSQARIIGGGVHSTVWRQIVADILNLDVLLPETVDASYGAALIAGVGVGVFANEEAAAACARVVSTTTPNPEQVAFYDELYALYKKSQAGLAEVNHGIARLLDDRGMTEAAYSGVLES